jgi:predicted ABC-type sugar transport system permease subunit
MVHQLLFASTQLNLTFIELSQFMQLILTGMGVFIFISVAIRLIRG